MSEFELPAPPKPSRLGVAVRLLAGLGVVALAAGASCLVMVAPGEALVVTRFGNPVRVLTQPGPAFKAPMPIETSVNVDLRLRTTSSGLQDVGTKDGLRILVQAYAAWQIDGSPDHVRQFLRAARNDPNGFADQLRSFMGSAMQVTASQFYLTDLINADASKCRLPEFEQKLQAHLSDTLLSMYGVRVLQIGTERLSLPSETLAATVARMRAERETVAAERTAQGLREAAAIRSDAERDARIIAADAQQKAAEIDAQSRIDAGKIEADAYLSDPGLYTLMRSLDSLGHIVNGRTRLVLRADSAPFSVLVDGPNAVNPPPSTPSGTKGRP